MNQQDISRLWMREVQNLRDAHFALMAKVFTDPTAYWKPETTYKGIGAKRRLYMKGQLR